MFFDVYLSLIRPVLQFIESYLIPNKKLLGVFPSTIVVYLVLLISLIFYNKFAIFKNIFKTKPSKYIIFFTIPNVLTLLFVEKNIILTIQSIINGFLIAVFVYIGQKLYENNLNRYFKIISFVIITSFVFAFYQTIEIGIVSDNIRVASFWGASHILANTSLIFAIFLTFYFYFNKKKRYKVATLIIMTIFNILVSGHRAAAIIYICFLILLSLGNIKYISKKYRISFSKIIVAFFFLMIFAGIFLYSQRDLLKRYLNIDTGIRELGYATYYQDKSDQVNSTLLYRAMIWGAVQEDISNSTFFIKLFGNGERAIEKFTSIGYYGRFEVSDPGSAYSYMLYNFGYIKILFFTIMCFLIFKDGYLVLKNSKTPDEIKIKGIFLSTFIFLLIFWSLVEIVFIDNLMGVYFWMTISLFYNKLELYSKSKTNNIRF